MTHHPDVTKALGIPSKGMVHIAAPPPPFDLNNAIEKMITWIINDDQSLRVVESIEFRNMILAFNPSLSTRDIPSRTTIHNYVTHRYATARDALKTQLQAALGRISFTTDLWTHSTTKSFMAVTLHWIARTPESDLELKVALGGFRYIRDKHDGPNIARNFLQILEELGISGDIGAVALDSASNNDNAMARLEEFLEDRGFNFSPAHQRVRCFSHVINLAVSDLLYTLPKPEKFQPRDIENQALKDAYRQAKRSKPYSDILKTDLVGRISGLIKQLRASGQRREAFEQAIISTHHDKRIDPPLKVLQLLCPVVTRWSSTFFMLDRFQYLYPAVDLFLSRPNPASLKREHGLNEAEAAVLEDIREVLSFFHSCQETLA